MGNALIGYSGFVGSTLLRQASFDSLYRSTNIGDVEGQSFDTVVCAGTSATKWIANRDPEADWQKVAALITHLKTLRCSTFILISTVDVFKDPTGVDENSLVDESGLHAYGLHRRSLEKFVNSQFPNSMIVRLPGLVGPGLRKNIIFDLLNSKNLEAIESRAVFQFYPMVNLWYDIQMALDAGLKLVHLTAQPISVAEVSKKGFGKIFDRVLPNDPPRYAMQTVHAQVFGCNGRYQYTARETIQAIRAYAQSEPLTTESELEVKS
jgi:nucleoside-diphosphate-sugar epimerase